MIKDLLLAPLRTSLALTVKVDFYLQDSSYRRLSHEVDLKCRSYIIYQYDTTVWLSAKTVTSIQFIDSTYNGVQYIHIF